MARLGGKHRMERACAAFPERPALILPFDLLSQNQGIADQIACVQIPMAQVNRGNLVIIVGGVIIDSLIGVTAAGIDGDLIAAMFNLTAASLLVDRAQNVEKLADAFRFGIPGYRVHPGKGYPYEPGL